MNIYSGKNLTTAGFVGKLHLKVKITTALKITNHTLLFVFGTVCNVGVANLSDAEGHGEESRSQLALKSNINIRWV